MMKVVLSDQPISNAAVTVKSTDDALPLLLSGSARLAKMQDIPPAGLLEELRSKANNIEKFGRKIEGASIFERIDKMALRGGIRQSMIEGRELPWFRGKLSLIEAAETCLSDCNDTSQNLFRQAQDVCVDHYENRSDSVRLPYETTEEAARGQGLAPDKKPVGFVDVENSRYRRVGTEWLAYDADLRTLADAVRETVKNGLAENRILCIEETCKTDHVVGPVRASSLDDQNAEGSFWYCFTKDLPSSWLTEGSELHERRNVASKWMEMVASHFTKDGRRVSNSDLIAVAMEKFGLSENASKAACKKADLPNRGESGNIPAEKRVSLQEINAL